MAYNWGGLFGSCFDQEQPTGDATKRGKAQKSQSKNHVKKVKDSGKKPPSTPFTDNGETSSSDNIWDNYLE